MKPPFRADHVGSLVRPPELAEARAQFADGVLTAEELANVEHKAIAAIVRRQESIGLESITEGEFGRDWWHIDFLTQLDGVTTRANYGPQFGGAGDQPPVATVTDKVDCSKPIMVNQFEYLQSIVRATPKFTIPSPSMLHIRGGRKAISSDAYPELDEFWADVSAAYRKAIVWFAAAGCSYLQLDDVAFSYLCDPAVRENCRRNGDDPKPLARRYADTINSILADKPAGMTVTMHTCRGNFRGAWVAEGGYEAVAEAMFSIDVDGFFMEFDSARAGTFEPLRFLPEGKKAVLGLVTTKVGKMEKKDLLKRRIDAAARFVPLENLCLSPQCGFSSTHHGAAVSEVGQWRKLELVVDTAHEVWG
ncbi:5-methyltetrahydropteroyltriglutamate--homocysteine S-methyltransferase [Candidatus Rariloculus sp.]|uniref:5-methyltetrahydropteroyltriglutamate-- homocysteine S-methyltransferase n=1 Tax=Candidatus Rariloculus sp. TaxID=3101265 RepID=UPI003D128594